MPQGHCKDKLQNWKNKAISRGQENKELRRQILVLQSSRENWKSKYMALKTPSVSAPVGSEKARGHQYAIAVVLFLVMLQRYGNMSLRGCRQSLICLCFMGFSHRIPSHNSIRNWVCKCGYFRVCKKEKPKESYVVYADESIVFGSEKILLLLGLPLSAIPLDRSVCHADLEVLYVGISDSWKGEDIHAVLADIAAKTPIAYIVGDEGTNLKKAYSMGNYSHIEDCTHIFANLLKHCYQKDVRFETFRSLIGAARKAFYLSKAKSQWLPPTLRGKLRFVNVFPCVEWAQKMLAQWHLLTDDVKTLLAFLPQEQAFIAELGQQQQTFNKVCSLLKNGGFSEETKTKILACLPQTQGQDNHSQFATGIRTYLQEISQKCTLLKMTNCLCSSDVIESYFGKFKQKINPSNKNHLSEFVLTLANFGKDFDHQEVKNALENVKIVDLKDYKGNTKKRDKK